MVKSTDIPNGYVVQGSSGRNILVDIDEKGQPADQAIEVKLEGWPDFIMEKGIVRQDILVLVHTVKGESAMLVKRLTANRICMDGKPTSVAQVARRGALNKMVVELWGKHMAEMRRRDGLAEQIEKNELPVGKEEKSAIEDALKESGST